MMSLALSEWPTKPVTASVKLRKPRLNHPKKPPLAACSSWSIGFRIFEQSIGVRVKATTTESTMAETIVIEN